MRKMESKVFMSCIEGDVYKEFTLDEATIHEVIVYLENGVKDRGIFTQKDMNNEEICSLKRTKLMHILTTGKYLSLAEFYSLKDPTFNVLLKKVLSQLKMKPFFQIGMEQVNDWFYCMNRCARCGSVNDYLLQEKLFADGIKNTEYLRKLQMKIVNNQFICAENTDKQNTEKSVMYVKKEKRIS